MQQRASVRPKLRYWISQCFSSAFAYIVAVDRNNEPVPGVEISPSRVVLLKRDSVTNAVETKAG